MAIVVAGPRRRLVGLVLAAGCATAHGDEKVMTRSGLEHQRADVPRGRSIAGHYAATIVDRGGGCCSESCAARSTITSMTLEVGEGGRAEARWTRRGCTVTLTGDGPLEVPHDPGPPDALCQQGELADTRREVHSFDGAGRLHGSWEHRKGVLQVELRPDADQGAPWVLHCSRVVVGSPDARSFGPLLSCQFVETGREQSVGFEVDGSLYLDDEPGLTVRSVQRGLQGPEEVEFEYSRRAGSP